MNTAAKLYKALGNETRLSMVQELARRNEEVLGTQILQSCSSALQLAQPTISQHFSKLVACGALIERKQGTEKFYRLNEEVFEAAGINIEKWKGVHGEGG